jgi:capsular polysaccharide export protein
VPWTFSYYGLATSGRDLYRPLGLLLSRLTAPLATIHCRRGRARELQLPEQHRDRRAFAHAVQAYYAGAPLRPPAPG